MKTKDLLKYFLNQCNLFTIQVEENCGKSAYRQIFDEFNCGYSDVYQCSAIVPGDYLVTYKPHGLKPSFILFVDDVIRYFTLIEEE